MIAQDFIDHFPEALDIPKEVLPKFEGDVVEQNDKYGLSYTDVIPLLVSAIKELSTKVTALENA